VTDAPAELRSRLDHVAISVVDIDWHVRFFEESFGMRVVRDRRDDVGAVEQCWLDGGLQLLAGSPVGDDRLVHHVALVCADVGASLSRALERGATKEAGRDNWIRLPAGLVVELLGSIPPARSGAGAPVRDVTDG
jgi:catechol 2,3-dioxygenase-like lactoylglutathione lyase family enzyme